LTFVAEDITARNSCAKARAFARRNSKPYCQQTATQKT